MAMSAEVIWVVLGLVLFGLEMLTGTFAMLLIAIASFLTAAIVWFGFAESMQAQIFIAGALSGLSLLIFRGRLKQAWSRRNNIGYAGDAGESLTLTVDIPPGQKSEVNYQGTKWICLNDSDRLMQAGESVKIVRVDGVKLILK